MIRTERNISLHSQTANKNIQPSIHISALRTRYALKFIQILIIPP